MAKRTSIKNKDILKGTNAADVLTVKHSQVTVNAGKGNDKINVNSGSKHRIYGDAGKDTITVGAKAGTGMKVYGDDAKGKLTGNDTFNINGGKKNYFYGGKGVDTFNVNAGTTNYIYGGAGNDVIVIGKTSTGTAVVKDFSVKSGNKDTVKVTGGAVKSIAVSGKNMIVKGGKSASVTLQNAKSKTFTVTDTLGSYTVSGVNVKLALGKNVKGTVTAASFITTLDGRSDANAITINGNAKNNTIYGGAGNNILNGGTGNDTLSGGAGKDTFVYANGQGKDIITDYAAGQDTLQITSGSISKTALANSNKDVVFTVGSGSITLNNASTKAISLKDSRGSYTVSNTAIILGGDFTGTMDATKYLSSVETIDGRNTTKAVNIIGNAQDNIIYAGKAGGKLNGGAGDDVYTINLPNESKVSLIEIDNSGQLDSDADCLVIENLKGVNPDIHFDRKRTVLTINTSQGTIITVKNWDTNPLSYLLLSGISTLTTDQINSVYGTIKYVKISKNSTTYYGDIDTQKIDVACINSDIHTGISGDIVTIIGSTANGSNTITGGQNNRIYGGPGSDLIKDSKYRNTIYGGDGDDEIHGSTVGKIYGDNGDDIIEVLNASGYFVNGGAGSDQITVVGRSGSFYGEDGNDTFTIYGTSDENYNIQIDGGSGNDTYICDIRGLEENGILTIDNQSASKTDMDFLKVMWTKAEEFILSLNEDSTELTIKQSSNNAGIVVKGWDTCPLSKIEFSDATYTAEQINTMVAASSQVDLGALQSACLTFGYSSVMGNQELTELTIAGGNKQQIQVVPTNTK